MRYASKLWVQIVASVVLGFLLAGAGTKITYFCPPVDGAAGCVSFEKAIMHPADLLHNKQDSLIRFGENFAVFTLASFVLIKIFEVAQGRVK